MLRKKYSKYIYLGVTLLLVVIASAVFVVIFSNLPGFFKVIGDVLRVGSFMIYGVIFAYLMNPIMKPVEKLLRRLFGKTNLTERTANRISRALSVIVAVVAFLLILTAIVVLIIPQIVTSLQKLFNPENLRSYYDQIITWSDSVTHGTPLEGVITEYAPKLLTRAQTWLTKEVMGNLMSYLTTVLSELYNVASSFLIGLVVAIYFLSTKEKFQSQAKKLVVAMHKPKRADRVLELARRTNEVFGGYIVAKIIESLAVGVMAYLVFLIIGIPYQTLLSVILGLGILVPIFGPIIAAVLGGLLVLLLSPGHALGYLISVLIILQVDGNVLGPKILGDRLGLSNFWVVVIIALFGGLFGLPGLVFGLPVFAVLYSVVRDRVELSLKKKGRPSDTDVYYSILTVADLNKYQREYGEPTVFFSEDTFDTEYDPDDDFSYFDPDET